MTANYHEIAKLVQKAKQKDSQAFTSLYQLTYQKMYYFAFSILRNPDDAQEATQEIYLKILSSINQLADDKLFVAWANRIAYNVCMKQLNERVSTVPAEDALDDLEDKSDSTSPLTSALKNERQRLLMEAVNELDPVLKSTILFKYYDDLKITEIAQIMDCPSGTVKSRLNTAKRQLKECIQKSRKGEVLLGAFGYFALRNTLLCSASKVNLATESAHHILVQALETQHMNINVNFSPQINAAPAAYGLIAGSTAAAVAGGALVTTLALQAPSIAGILIPTTLSNTYSQVMVQVEGGAGVMDVHASSEDGTVVTGTKTEKDTYQISIPLNGTYHVTVTSENGKTDTADIKVANIDKEVPVIVNYSNNKQTVSLQVSDNLSGVDFSSIYGITDAGSIRITPDSIDEDSGTVVFSLPDSDFQLYMSDMLGNTTYSSVKIIRTTKEVIKE